MFPTAALVSLCFLAVTYGQQIGTQVAEVHPPLPIESCSAGGSCTTLNTAVVLDSNWRWLHSTKDTTNCYTGNTWIQSLANAQQDATLCPDPTTCATNCALDGADYASTYGITTTGNSLKLDFVTGSNVGSRVYLMASTNEYQMFKLVNQEFTFTVDMSNLGCGINGALYLSEMDADGGMARFPATNKAGAQYGVGYCDSQCPQDIKFINGLANIEGWAPDSNDANTGTGNMGTCCNEMDIWEANKYASAYTPHPCSVVGQTSCTGDQCGATAASRDSSLCDHDGCDFNSWRMGNQTFFGPGLTVDTSQPVTVVTQFVSSDGTSTGTLSAINRLYVQNNKVIDNSFTNLAGVSPAVNGITDDFCAEQKSFTGDDNYFATLGGLKTMGESLTRGMVLALSIWDDYAAGMYWLDSDYPLNASTTAPGVSRGPCSTTSGNPPTVESQQGSNSVTYSNIKFGPIGSTFSSTGTQPGNPTGSSSSPVTSPTSPPTGGQTVAEYGQCGGMGYTGATVCASPFTCNVVNPYYSQCL
ncbi:cellulase [Roridomyces roridus]|uniref:Glucanase n=1 Tax=Roridomyces roridus TaxID=1738132 RepID=A0AAD7BCQ9_9AGAR|nr:cellulase [Roridomyces roridus]